MTLNDNDIYLIFVEIERILDNFNAEYESFNNRIEFYTINHNQIIIDAKEDMLFIFHKNKKHTFSIDSSKKEIFKFIENLLSTEKSIPC